MSVPHRIPGLFLMALCHVTVIYHMLERRYSRGKFVLLSCLYVASFVCMGVFTYMVSGITATFSYLGVAVCLFFFFLYCFKGVSSQEKLFVPYLFWFFFHIRQQLEINFTVVFAALARLTRVFLGNFAAPGTPVFVIGFV